MDAIPSITPAGLAVELTSSAPPKLLDVREARELEISRFEEIVHIPLAELPERFGELDPCDDWVVVCRSGNRSAWATRFLLSQGFLHVRNMADGMNGWSKQIDPSVRTY